MLRNKFIILLSISLLVSNISSNAYSASLSTDVADPFNKTKDNGKLDLNKINASQSFKINDVVIRGTNRKEEVLITMSVRAGSIVNEEQIKQDIQNIYNLGYFNENVNYAKEPYNDGYRLIINLTDNPKLRSIQVKGNTLVKTEVIKKQFSNQLGKTINFNDLKASLVQIRDSYTKDGYQAVFINPAITNTGDMTLNISEGVIEEVKINGNKDTHDDVIRREIRQKPGQIYNSYTFEEDKRRLTNTNFFEKVDLKYEPGKINPNNVIVIVDVKEQQTGTFNPGISYSVRDGLTAYLALTKENLFGTGQSIGINFNAGAGWFAANSGWNFLGRLDWSDPWFLPQILPARTGFGVSLYRQRENNLFQTISPFNSQVNNLSSNYVYPLNNDRTGMAVSISRAIFGDPITSPFRIGLTLKGESIAPLIPSLQDTQLKQDNVSRSYSDLEKSTDANVKNSLAQLKNKFDTYTDTDIRKGLTLSKRGYDNRFAPSITFSYDTRDYPLQPHDGWNNLILAEPSFGDISYFKIYGIANKYTPLPVFDQLTFAVSAKIGALTGDRISVYEKFYSSGNDSIRGWPENGYLSGERIFIGSAELRFPIYNIVSGVAFIDAGNFWNQDWKVTDANVADTKINGKLVNQNLLNPFLRLGYGLGVRVNTPIGMLRLDYGIRDITRPFDLNGGAQVHFNMGQKF